MKMLIKLSLCAAIFTAATSHSLLAADMPALPPLPPLPGDTSSAPLPVVSSNSKTMPDFNLPDTAPLPANNTSRTVAIEPLPVPPLPSSNSSPTLSPATLLPPPGSNNFSDTIKHAGESIIPPPTQTADADSKSEEAPKHAKKKHHGVTKEVVSQQTERSLHPTYYISEPLPEAIYRKSYDRFNRHLPIAYYERDYDTLVFVTAAHDDLNGLRSLLDNGRNVELMDVAGDTPLLVAVKHNAINTARLLLARHANPQVIDRSGLSALQIAIRMHNYPMQRALEEMGASPMQMSAITH